MISMKYAIKALVALPLLVAIVPASADSLRDAVLRDAVLDAGLRPVEELWPEFLPERAEVGRALFESDLLSLTRNVSCRNCHLDEFGSADGLPLGLGAGGVGKGIERIKSPAGVLARNALALWGRGGIGYNVFFWDGRVDGSSGEIQSQFGDFPPSTDPLVVADHLPTVEFREMISETDATEQYRQGDVYAAASVHQEIASRVRGSGELALSISKAFGIEVEEITYLQIAESLAAFIRSEFRLQPTKLHEFAFNNATLTDDELSGGLLFYGRGRCSSCHNGPYFTDFDYHAIPFGQFGFGVNGFGIDYGRYNVTLNPKDRYAFKTPSLYNVTKTSPYSHSGVEPDLAKAIKAHVDPLAEVDTSELPVSDRNEIYQKIGRWSQEPSFSVELNEEDIANLVAFLQLLDFDPLNK